MLESLFSSGWYTYLILPLLIFIGRIVDVGIGTIRVIFVSKGFKKLAPILSFFEILIWLLVIKQIFDNLTNPVMFFSYAAGFATGTYVGMRFEEKLSVGKVMINIITETDVTNLLKKLKEEKYGVTVMAAEGSRQKVQVIFSIVERKEVPKILKFLKEFNPKAFYSIEDVRFAHEHSDQPNKKSLFDFFRGIRKGK
jgi:uncharacterized protein YebE (UPF0316 family)